MTDRSPALIAIPATTFRMGSDAGEGYRADGEGPQRMVTLRAFSIAPCAVTNEQFAAFVRDTRYVTDAERAGWSFVFHRDVAAPAARRVMGVSAEARWWVAVEDACWQRALHPVVHVSWHDAEAYCRWTGTRLPSEAQWECAARGGLDGRRFPWGDELHPGGRHRCNIWQGTFPVEDRAEDGHAGTAPVDAYEPNGFGLYNVAGNVWEWCADWFSPDYHRVTHERDPQHTIPTGRRAMRGGSFLCHRSYCHRYRVAARGSNAPDGTASHCGFRVAADAPARREAQP